MANTMKKSEVQSAARAAAHDILNFQSIEGLRQIGPDEYAFPAYTTPEGDTVFYSFKGAVKNWKSTEKVAAFDIEGAAAEYQEDVAFKAKVAAEKAEAKAKKIASKTK